MPFSRRLRHADPVIPPYFPPGLLVWSKADQIGDVADGGSLTGWQDLSGNNRNWTVSSSPKYRATAGPGGTPAVEVGTGGGDGYFVAGGDLLTAMGASAELFLVTKAAADSGNAGMNCFSNSTSSAHYHYTNANTIYETWMLSGGSSRLGPLSTGSLTQWRLYGVSAESTSYIVRLDGSTIGSSGATVMGAGTLGHLGDSVDHNCIDQQYSEIMIYNRVLTAIERSVLYVYFAARFGLVLP